MPEDEEIIKEPEIISKHDFYFETPLYREVNAIHFKDSVFKGEVDAYNPVRGFETTYSIEAEKVEAYNWSPYKNVYRATLTCKRAADKLIFFVQMENADYQKIGQYPSLATIQFAEIEQKYSGTLSEDDLKSFKTAIDLAAQGIGAGSFVYLRKIFEDLIWETYSEHKAKTEVTEEKFRSLWMTHKVETLKDYLPSQLVEMKGVYDILSKGVHELTEKECLAYFPAVKLSIDLILEQKIEAQLKQARDTDTKTKIGDIQRLLKKKD